MLPEAQPLSPALCIRPKCYLGHQEEKGPWEGQRGASESRGAQKIHSFSHAGAAGTPPGHLELESIFLSASYPMDGLSLGLSNGLA